jgi:uncharacterized protein YlbG (UPF0298 family)
MADILAALEKTKIDPLEITGRTAVYVYYSSYKHVRQLTRLGDLVYSSKKARYVLLYVDTSSLDMIISKLKALHFVKEIKVSAFDHLDLNFSSAFQKTVDEAKAIFDE